MSIQQQSLGCQMSSCSRTALSVMKVRRVEWVGGWQTRVSSVRVIGLASASGMPGCSELQA